MNKKEKCVICGCDFYKRGIHFDEMVRKNERIIMPVFVMLCKECFDAASNWEVIAWIYKRNLGIF